MGEAMHTWGQKTHGKSLPYALLGCEPKTANLKRSPLKKKISSWVGRDEQVIAQGIWIYRGYG